MNNPATVSEAIADVIAERANHVFGLVGNANSHVVASLTQRGFPYTSLRHEMGTVAAADAFYRAGGGIAVSTTTCGAGLTNAMTSLAEARVARIPLVHITGTAPSAGPRPFDINQDGLIEALDIPIIQVTAASAAADATAAFDLAEATRSPVVLHIPFDLQAAELVNPPAASAVAFPTQNAVAESVDQDTIAELADALAGATRPLIIIGRGVAEAGLRTEVAEFIDELGALHMHTAMARNIVGGHWCLGTAGGFAHKSRLQFTQDADLVLILGASFNAYQARGGKLMSPGTPILHVLDEPHPASQSASTRVFGDLRDVLPRLRAATVGKLDANRRTWRDEIVATMGELPPVEDPELHPELFGEAGSDGRIDPRAALRRLDRLLPQDRTVVTDGGHFIGWVPKYLDSPEPAAQILVGTAIQSIGLGLSSAVGAAAARPDKYTILVTGDGGGLMALADLESTVRSLKRGLIIVMNDAAYGAELHQYAAEGLDTTSMTIADVDFAALGRAFGATGITVGKPADWDAAQQTLAQHCDGVCLLDIKISRTVVADFIEEILKRQ
ncbi:thiamine pyrophosphate-binding protein [Corynebacterium sp. TAE3-ERU12]|uniref:thiamine pyrophosphate-binding protein n=1 Tax=Corynebacterium sp. TAE3-ERU12 TaxID=2849491 RepID=UPI001C43D4FA|nr:thiamine pyrophosphate-binding protein [Corynebacterium sp. TAE3-ERU12]MBV7295829.1 thiamine pyrophosphate-binding protein [Corynebacterium sp. TAE3-ERU12]